MAFVDEMSEEDINGFLERFDHTEPQLQRRIIAQYALESHLTDGLLNACQTLLMLSLPRDVSGERMVAEARSMVEMTMRIKERSGSRG